MNLTREQPDQIESKKILIISEDFPPYPGGIAQWALGVAGCIHRQEYQVYVITRLRENHVPAQQPYPLLFMEGQHWKKFRTQYVSRAFRNFLEQRGVPDLVIATTWNCARGLVPLTCKLGIKTVVVAHGLDVTRTMPFWKRWWLKRTMRRCDVVVAVSRFTGDFINQRYHLPHDRVLVLPNGVDTSRFHPVADTVPVREHYGITDEKVILTLARVIERKGHDAVIRILPRLREHFKKIKYIISGPWEDLYYKKLKQLVSDLDLEDFVIFTGFVPDNELNDLYNLCDVYIMPSREMEDKGDTEGFGITYLEAGACEKPVIGGASGGVPDAIVHGETGFLVDPLNIEDIGDKLVKLLGNPGMCRTMGRQGRARIQADFTWESVTRKLLLSVFEHGYTDKIS
jgi:phosphatidylinositol alpha-1,6-mannosyltransferase